jgi:beta-glucoside operon transcriptional antiterminator
MINIKKCNNNIILAVDDGQEVVVLGKGIGFNSRPGEEVDPSLVEKVFVPQTSQMSRFKDILADLPYEYLLLSSKIVDHGKKHLKQPLNQSIVIALADHLCFATTRLKDNLYVQMPLTWDIKHIYPLEFSLGMEALDIIKEEINVDFPKAEAAAIALHFINAETDCADMPNTVKMSVIIKESVEIVENRYKTVFNENTPDFNGFVTLLRNTIIRFIYHPDEKQVDEDIELYNLLRKR